MPTRRLLILAACLSATLSLPVHAAVTVTSAVDPDKFSDAGDRNNDPRKVMQALADHLKELGNKYLPPGTNLAIEVFDVDRAGRPRMNLPTEIRVVSGKGDIPCIDLKYTLETGGKATQSNRERVCDTDFLRALGPRYDEHDPLVYETRMLDEWFRKRFAKGEPAR
jgi:hypothetical protein